MQRAENVPDAFFRFTLETSPFAVFAAESRSARFSGARNKSLHHAPHPAVVPVPYSHRHRRAKFWRPDSKSFCRFCAAAVPRDRQTGSRGISRSALIQTSLRFVCRAVCDAQKTEKRREFSGQDVQLYNRARTAIRLPPGQGCAPTPRQRLTAREKIPRTAHRSRTRQTENRGAPRLWRGFRFCD